MSRHWLFNPLAALKKRHRTLESQLESNLEKPSLGLPATAHWPQYLTQTILVGVTLGLGWSILARVDVVVNATGKLEPKSQSQAIQSRAGGVVTVVRVREGQAVKRGQLLLQLDKTTLHNQLQNLSMQRRQLIQEIAVLRMAQQGQAIAPGKQKFNISPELLNQVQTRLLLVAQLSGDPSRLDPLQQQRYALYQQQLRDRQSLSRLQITSLASQIDETEAQTAQTQFQLKTEQELLTNLQPLVEQGAIPRVTLLQRKVGVSELQTQLSKNNLQRRQLEIGQLQTQVETGKSLTEIQQDLQRQLAALDSQFDITIKESQRQLIDVNAKLKQVQLDLFLLTRQLLLMHLPSPFSFMP
jgi:hemolysin D